MNTQAQPGQITPTLWEGFAEARLDQSTAPLLKWPGGKRYLIPHLKRLIPSSYGRYFEAFAGGAALFFALRPKSGLLADTNAELVNCYTQVRDHPAEVVDVLASLPNTEQDYYRIRSLSPSVPAARAARLIYLVTLSFNGIYRENRLGQFNVPYGHKTHIIPCVPAKIYAASVALTNTEIVNGDFAVAVTEARAGDLVYLDPPYTLAHENNGFVKYNAKIFSWPDQLRLAEVAKELHKRACYFIITNAAHASISELYNGFTIVPIVRHSIIAAAGKHRKPVTEYIVHNGSTSNVE